MPDPSEPIGGAAAPVMLVDGHAHIWGPDMPILSTAWTRPTHVYSAEDYLADLDAHGIGYGVVAAASLFGTYNDYVIRALRRHKRLRGTANVDPAIEFYTLEAMRADGIVGVRLQWFMKQPLPDLTGDDYQCLLRRLRDLDMHVHLNIEGERLIAVCETLMASGVRLVIDHYGWHDPAVGLDAPSYQAMLRLIERGNVWVKVTAGFRHPTQKIPEWSLQTSYCCDLLARFGPEKLLWGSDTPFVGHEDAASYATAIDMLDHCLPDPATRRAIGENGWRFYFGD